MGLFSKLLKPFRKELEEKAADMLTDRKIGVLIEAVKTTVPELSVPKCKLVCHVVVRRLIEHIV